jgi:hypothetical protein
MKFRVVITYNTICLLLQFLILILYFLLHLIILVIFHYDNYFQSLCSCRRRVKTFLSVYMHFNQILDLVKNHSVLLQTYFVIW